MKNIKNDHFVHVIGSDFDDCLLRKQSEGSTVSIGQLNKVLFLTWMRQRARAYAATYFYSSSNRQSWAVDDNNRQDHTQTLLTDLTSSFLACKAVAEREVGCTFWSYLLADAYSERPFGYSYSRAIVRATDDTAYHPGYVFDEHKFSLLYVQAHLAANNMRHCDFLSLASRPTADNVMQFPFKSNAAYIYIQTEQVLLYVNKAQNLVKELVIKAQADFKQMLANVNERISNISHDFEMLYQDNVLIKGITLSEEELKRMASISDHLHEVVDWLIIFDFYDDREDILRVLKSVYTEHPDLLPSNLILRLNLYSVNNPGQLDDYFAINGKGYIDSKPGETVVTMAKSILQKKELIEDDYLSALSFSDSIEKIISDDYFKNRSLAKPTIKHKKSSRQYASHEEFNCVLFPNEILSIRRFIQDKTAPSLYTLASSTFFNKNSERNLYNPIITLLKSLLTSQTEEEVVAKLENLFDSYRQTDYLLTIGEDTSMDKLLRATYTGYLEKIKQRPVNPSYNPNIL